MLDACRFLYVSGRPDRGLEIAAKARAFSLAIADEASLSTSLTLLGVCAADTGNLPLAMEAYADALTLAQATKDPAREGKIWHNLGAALIYSGLYREAIACSTRALDFVKLSKELEPNAASLQTNIALCHLNLDEISQGLAAIRKAVELSSDPTDAHSVQNRVLAENYFTRLLLEVSNFEGAREHAQLAREFAALSKSPRADITASVAEGLTEVFSGQVDVGISRLSSTLDRAIALKVTTREVLRALVKAFEFIGQHDKALEYLNLMLSQQRKTQEANVLRHVKRHLAQLHPSNDESGYEDAADALKNLATRAEVLEGRVAKRELKQRDHELFKARVEVMERLAVAAELRDDSTGEHSYRVGRLASLLAKESGCDEDMIFMIDIAARLHDIGKVGIPDGILLKPAALNPTEREIMKTHAVIGAEVLAKSQIPHMQMAEEIARSHHEWWDGSGYPAGISGMEIPHAARITALADVFDALTHKRSYKQAWTLDSALTEILALRGRQFDPDLTDHFLGLVSRLRDEYGDLDALLGQAAHSSPFLLARSKIQETLQVNRDPAVINGLSRFDLQR
jgi:putative two-component system response regulator